MGRNALEGTTFQERVSFFLFEGLGRVRERVPFLGKKRERGTHSSFTFLSFFFLRNEKRDSSVLFVLFRITSRPRIWVIPASAGSHCAPIALKTKAHAILASPGI